MRIHAWAFLLVTSLAVAGCLPADPCATANGGCAENATCTATGEVASCSCKAGFSGDGKTCADVDECATANGGCAADATCTNTVGGRTCTCKVGYAGDGVTCADVDECATANGGCAPDATCTNTVGGRTCACKAGYAGDGGTCGDVDECATANGGCPANATCTNTPGSRTCTCKAGFAGAACDDVNECPTVDCGAFAFCVNSPGSYTCQCAPGFAPDGGTCDDEDECITAKCTANSTCINHPGGFECRCNTGYGASDGGTCTLQAEVVATGLPAFADGLALDTAHGRLFATLDDGRVVGVPLDGGSVYTVADPQGSNPALHDIATDGEYVYWADPRYGDAFDGGIFAAMADGMSPPWRFAEAFTPSGVVVEGQALYWAQQDGKISSAPLPASAGTPATAATVMDGFGFGNSNGLAAYGIAAAGTDLYFIDHWGGKVGRIEAAGGGSAQAVASGLEQMWSRSITVGAANGHFYVYWTVPGFNARELWGFEVPQASGVSPTPVKLLTDSGLAPATFDAVAADDWHVYWLSNGQLLRLPLEAVTLAQVPQPEVVYAGGAGFDSLTALALDATHAYFATSMGREVMRVEK